MQGVVGSSPISSTRNTGTNGDVVPTCVGMFKKAVILLNNKCNFNCYHCYVRNGSSELPLDSFISFYNKTLKPNGIKDVHFIGGEPFLYSQFEQLASFLSANRDVRTCFTTNGSILTEKLINNLKKISPHLIKVSLLSLNPKTYRAITRADWDVNLILENIKNFSNTFTVGINITLTRDNEEELGKIAEFCLNNNLSPLCVSQLTLSGRAIEIKDKRLSQNKIEEYSVVKNITSGKLRVIYDEHKRCNFFNDIVLNYEGNVFPCCALTSYPEFKIGSWKSDLSTIVHNLNELNARKTKKCFVDEFVR